MEQDIVTASMHQRVIQGGSAWMANHYGFLPSSVGHPFNDRVFI